MPSGTHKAWCHFRHEPTHIPDQLDKLSRQAGLSKQAVSLSFVQLKRTEGKSKQDKMEDRFPARVVSNPFSLSGKHGSVCYLCTACGLGLLVDEKPKSSGNLLQVRSLGTKDLKSGALLMRLA